MKTLSILASLLLLPFAAQAQTAAFARVDGNWTSDVWATSGTTAVISGLRPTNGDPVRFGTNGVDITVDSVISGTFLTVQLQNAGANAATLTLNSGAVLNSTALNNAANGGTSIVTINTGAIWNVGATGVRVANSENSTGTITVAGGQLLSSGIFIVGGATAMTANLNFSGGTIQTTSLQKGAGSTANFHWTGGTLITPETNLPTIDNIGTGRLAVGGIDTVGTFVLRSGATTTYTQGADASLTLDLVSATTFDTIALGAGTALHLDLDGTVELNLLAGFTPIAGQTYDVITATTITDSGFVLGGNGASWFTSEIIRAGSTDILRLTAVPEPSTLALGLLATAGLITLKLRRKSS